MPYFLRSLTRESRVSRPSFFSAWRSSALNSHSARAMPEAHGAGLAVDAAAADRREHVELARRSR